VANHDVILIGGSSASGEALRFRLISGAMLFIAIHRTDLQGTDSLPIDLRRFAAMPVAGITHEQTIESDIYAPPRKRSPNDRAWRGSGRYECRGRPAK